MANGERDKYTGEQHNHITRDIKPEGWGCPTCDHYHEHARQELERLNAEGR